MDIIKLYLNLQHDVATNSLVMRFMIRIICITTVFVFDEGEAREHKLISNSES